MLVDLPCGMFGLWTQVRLQRAGRVQLQAVGFISSEHY